MNLLPFRARETDTCEMLVQLSRATERCGLKVGHDLLGHDTPARFNGLWVTLNRRCDPETRAFYLAHSVGSIEQWCAQTARTEELFSELRASKQVRVQNPGRFAAALDVFRRFELLSAEYGCGLLERCGFRSIVGTFSEFFRADLEAITEYHRTDRLPSWRPFWASWRKSLESGERQPQPFEPRPLPNFAPRWTEVQEVKQGL